MDSSNQEVSAIVVAAGSSRRMQCDKNKVLMDLGGVTVLEHSLFVLAKIKRIKEIIVVVSRNDKDNFSEKLNRLKVSKIVVGGEHRFDSVQNGIKACSPDTGLILIHDGARPFAPIRGIESAITSAAQLGAAILSVPLNDTVKRRATGHTIKETVPRTGLYLAQTPQVFKRSLLLPGINRAKEEKLIPTDEASVLENQNHPVVLVDGDTTNIKITTQDDLLLAKAILHLKSQGGANHDPFPI